MGRMAPGWEETLFDRLASDGERLAVGAALRFLAQLFPWAAVPPVAGLLPRRRVTAFLFHRLPADAVLMPESRSLRYRRKLFREALKLHV
jgi:hypothetical protein